jgi:hypothetical protein
VRPVPPRTDRDRDVVDLEVVAVGDDALHAPAPEPRRDLLAVPVGGIQVVVARARDDARPLRRASQVLRYDDDLRLERDERRDVERVARDDDEIEALGDGLHPIELLERVVKVGDEEAAHRRCVVLSQARRVAARRVRGGSAETWWPDAAQQPVAPGPDGGIEDPPGNFGTPMMGVITVQAGRPPARPHMVH